MPIGNEVEGLNEKMIEDYVLYLGNARAESIGLGPLYEGHEEEPSSMRWVSQYANPNFIKTDFIEGRSTAYAKSTALVDDL
jgi:ribonucleoside-diphosphate reductase beta chain